MREMASVALRLMRKLRVENRKWPGARQTVLERDFARSQENADGSEAPSDSQWRQVAKDAIGSVQKYNSMTNGIAFIPFDLVFRNNNLCSDIAVPSS